MAPFTIESKRHEVLKSDLQTCHFLMENSTSHSEFQEILTVGFCDVLCIHIWSMFRGKLFVSGRVSGVPLRIAVTTGIVTCLIGDSKFKLNLLLPLLLGGRHTQTIYTHTHTGCCSRNRCNSGMYYGFLFGMLLSRRLESGSSVNTPLISVDMLICSVSL